MPVEVSWYQGKYIIYTKFIGEVSAEDIQKSVADFNMLTEGNTANIHSLIDVSEIDSYPTKLQDMKAIINSMKSTPDQGVVIVVGASDMMRLLGNLVTGIAGIELRLVNSIEEAETTLERLKAMRVDRVSDD